MGVRSRSKRRRKALAAAADDDDDLISGLPDDVLLRVLDLLTDPGDAVRTAALSRRWRGLWSLTPALNFAFDSSRGLGSDGRTSKKKTTRDAARFVATVDVHLSLRAHATAATLDRLSILYDVSYPLLHLHADAATDDEEESSSSSARVVVPSAVRAAQGWVRHALRHAVKSFALELHLPLGHAFRDDDEAIVLDLDDDEQLPPPPGPAKMETMHLSLGDAPVHLPFFFTAASSSSSPFSSLTDVSLECMALAPGAAPLLVRLLSSASCPRLRKLRLRRLLGLRDLRLDAAALEELSFEDMDRGCCLELRTPSLRDLRVLDDCHGNGRLGKLTIASAPRLEALMFLKEQPDRIVVVDGELPLVERLKVDLKMYGHDDDDDGGCRCRANNDVSIRLLQCCTSATHLEVSLRHQDRLPKEEVLDIFKGGIPRLPHVTSLTVHAHYYSYGLHDFGFGLEHILKRCRNLKYLRVHCPVSENLLVQDQSSLASYVSCDHHPDHWKFCEMALPHLEELEFAGLAGIDCELWFVQLVLRSASQLRKVTVSFSHEYMRKRGGLDASKLISKLGGAWTACRGARFSYQWEPC